MFFFVLEKDDEARERDQMRYERHKDRARERNLSRAAPDKRYKHQYLLFLLYCNISKCN